MFTHLLVPLDFTHKNESAIQMAIDLATRDTAQVTLVHVVETIDNTAAAEFDAFYDRLREKSLAQLSAIATRLEQAGVVVDRCVVIGKPLAELAREAVERSADLVVLSSHKVDLEQGASSWSTLSYRLSVLCPCPVLLVK